MLGPKLYRGGNQPSPAPGSKSSTAIVPVYPVEEERVAKQRTCMHCGQPGGQGPRELRPYGPGGKDVCAECVFDGPPERIKQAKREFAKRMMTDEPLLLDASEQVGPRPLNPKGKA